MMFMPTHATKRSLCFCAAFMAALASAAPLNERAQTYLASKHEIVFAVQLRHAPFVFVERQQVSGMDDYLS
jgi:hypothetical protein